VAVTSEAVRIAHAGNGVTTLFAAPAYIVTKADLLVLLRDAAGTVTLPVLDTDYTVAVSPSPVAATVTFVVAPPTGTTVHLIIDPAIVQALTLAAGAALPVAALERTLDVIVHQQQRTRDLVLRAPTLADTETDGSGAFDARSNRIKNLDDPVSGQDAVTRAWALAMFAAASGPGALPPAASLVSAMWDPASPLVVTNVGGLSAAEMAVETDPFPAGVLSASATLRGALERIQWQLREILNWLDAGARTHGYADVPASDLPATVAAQIAAAFAANAQGANRLPNGSLMVAQKNPSESASGTVATGLDVYVVDRWFVMPTGGTVQWARQTAGLHSGSRSPIGVQLNGAAGITNVRFGVRLGRGWCRSMGALLANKNVTFGCKVRHPGSTGSLTPNLVVRSTSNTGPDSDATKFAAANMTTRLTQAFAGAIGVGAEAAFVHTFDLGAMVDSQNGIELHVDLGAMNAGTIAYVISDLWLSDGDISTSLLPDRFEDALDECLWTYAKTFAYATAPAQNAGFSGALAMTGASNACAFQWKLPRPMRGAPTVTSYNPGAANAQARNTAGDDSTGATPQQITESGLTISFTPTGSTNRAWHIQASADGEWYD
jgi:hypothetical protein